MTTALNEIALDGFEDFLLETTGEEHMIDPIPRSASRLSFTWPASLVVDVALAIDDLDSILERYGMSHTQWDFLSDNPAFKIELSRVRKEITENGLSFKRKAATQAEMYLTNMDALMCNPDVAPSVKHSIFTSLVKYGELEPKKESADSAAGGMAFNIQINM
jgi:hypothetical protein